MTSKYSQIFWWPQKISTKFSYPQNIYFSENPKKYRNSKLCTQKKWTEPTYVWKYQSTPPPPPRRDGASSPGDYARECEYLQFWKTNLSAVFSTNEECLKLLSRLNIGHGKRGLFHWGIVRGNKEFFRASLYVRYVQYWAILDTVWWPGSFPTVSRGRVLVFFYRHSTRMYFMKKKQGGPIPTGLKRWPLKHLADTTCVSPYPAGGPSYPIIIQFM